MVSTNVLPDRSTVHAAQDGGPAGLGRLLKALRTRMPRRGDVATAAHAVTAISARETHAVQATCHGPAFRTTIEFG